MLEGDSTFSKEISCCWHRPTGKLHLVLGGCSSVVAMGCSMSCSKSSNSSIALNRAAPFEERTRKWRDSYFLSVCYHLIIYPICLVERLSSILRTLGNLVNTLYLILSHWQKFLLWEAARVQNSFYVLYTFITLVGNFPAMPPQTTSSMKLFTSLLLFFSLAHLSL